MPWSIADAEIASEQPVTASLMTRLRNGGIETSVTMMARQNAAPLGWTKVTTDINNRAIRLFSGAPSDGGSLDFSTVFEKTFTDFLTLGQSHLPNYVLPNNLVLTGSQNGGLTRNFSQTDDKTTNNVGGQPVDASWIDTTLGIGGGVTLGGLGNSHRHPMDIRVRYIGFCVFQKT